MKRNIASLGFLQGANLLFPLITVPMLARHLGPQGYGTLSLVLAINGYLAIICEFGLTFVAARQVAAASSASQRTIVFSAALSLQLVLLAGACLCELLLVQTIPFLQISGRAYLAGFSTVIGSVLFPVWLFQGMERLFTATIIQLATRALGVALLYRLILGPSDLVLAALIPGAVSVLGGGLSLLFAARSLGVWWQPPKLGDVLHIAREAFPVAGSRLLNNSFLALVPFALGVTAGKAEVGYFALADKVRYASTVPVVPIVQGTFPRISAMADDPAVDPLPLIRKVGWLLAFMGATISATLGIFSPEVITLLAGKAFLGAVPVLRTMSVLPLIIALNNAMGIQVLLPFSHSRKYAACVAAGALLGCVLIWPACWFLGSIGAGASVVISELAALLSIILSLKQLGFLTRLFPAHRLPTV